MLYQYTSRESLGCWVSINLAYGGFVWVYELLLAYIRRSGLCCLHNKKSTIELTTISQSHSSDHIKVNYITVYVDSASLDMLISVFFFYFLLVQPLESSFCS